MITLKNRALLSNHIDTYNRSHIYTRSETNDVTHMFPLHYEQQHVLLAGMPKGEQRGHLSLGLWV